jgi:hypothetical protein
MKLLNFALVAASAISAAGQNNTTNGPSEIPGLVVSPPSLNLQIGCPVAFTDVVLKRDARYMPVRQGAEPDSSLEFKYKNQTGKLIESIEIQVVLKIKRSIYDLDAITITRDMTLSGNPGEVVPLNLLAYGVSSVTLKQVNYVDGKHWMPANENCRYFDSHSVEEIK